MNRIAHLTAAILVAPIVITIGATVATAAPAQAATIAAVTRCYTGQLALSLIRDGSAAGSTYYDVVFTNTSARPCTLTGYPGASARTAPAGPRIGHAATRDPVFPPAVVRVAASAQAHAVLRIGDAGNYPAGRCHPVAADAVAVYPPGAFHRLARPLSFEACARHRIHQMSITATIPGA